MGWFAHPFNTSINLTLSRPNQQPALQASIPVWATDATCMEALGPPFVALLLRTPPPSDVLFISNNNTVVDCIASRTSPLDIFLYHCTELCRDLLPHRLLLSAWITRKLNAHCDSLARHA